MRQVPVAVPVRAVFALVCAVLAGCVNGPRVPTYQQSAMRPPAPAPVAGNFQELQSRASSLDSDNQNLQALLAQQQQQTTQLHSELQRSQQRISSLQGELDRTRSSGNNISRGKTSAANTSYGGNPLPLARIPGAEVLPDGELVRIRLTNEQLFAPGKAELKPAVNPVLDNVARALQSEYAGRRIGIEGHTDPDPITRSKWNSNHELAVARSVAVFQALKKRGVPENQLFVAGHGPNRPIADNRSQQGKSQNRRVEVVVYPEPAR